ncbi:MAG: DNA polymerase III subunit alpha [Chitinivibrionales bacterium]|nr:DNA polymerase III subunit alpha [Chitinivibrionales bacterium]MBD3394357.1 DNA polymerase III subunit alpha [Chitinivibrionales bacterium]
MATSSNFVHLHNHTEYSFLDGAMRIEHMVKRAREWGMPALAITDHGGLFGAVEFYDTCVAQGIKPILGFEAYVAPRSRTDRSSGKDERNYNHLLLLARNEEGWKNLMRLSTIGYLEGFYYKPRIDTEVLREHARGLVGTSACVAGAIPRAILAGDRERAKAITEEYLSVFEEGNFYFELQNHGIDEEIVAFDEMIKLGNELGVPFIVANDAHYLAKEDAASHEVLLCLQTQSTLSNPNHYRFSSDEIYFKSPQEMAKLFPDLPEALSNTVAIAEQCSVNIKAKPQLPVPDVPGGFESPADYLRELARKGLADKYAEVTPALEERLDFELKVICSMGYAGYFLIVRDFVQATRDKGIMVNTRGSASGSLVGHAIGISMIDPIKYDLLFERFLNPERVSMPDIDVDFPDEDRYQVIDYVVSKYGRESVCQIINYGRMKAKMAVRDVARVLEIPIPEADALSKQITEDTLEKSLQANGELARTVSANPRYQELFKHARAIEGLARQAGMHAGGVIIAPGPVVKWSPLFKQPSHDSVMTQFDMNFVEKVGLIKMDFLGLRTFTLLQETLRLIKQYHGASIDLWQLEDGDRETYELFGRGETTGVFQFESQGMQDYLRKLKPTSIEDIIAMAALYRPGPMKNIDSFIHRKHGKEKVVYPHPMLKEILDVTYGVIVYQEQVMRIAQSMAGFSLGQADVLRKAMGKKQAETMEETGKEFVEAAVKRGIDRKAAQDVFGLMEKFAMYGFPKGHATSYAHVSYFGAYLKAHYPIEYMTANLTSWIGNQDQFLVMKNEAERMGIQLLPPDVNRSEHKCSIDNGSIRLGLAAIKNVGKATTSILEARAEKGTFSSMFDLCRSVDLRLVNKKCLESLVCAGALDSLPGTRARKFAAVDMAIDFASGFQKDRITGQTDLFRGGNGGAPDNDAGFEIPEPSLPDVPPWPYNELLVREKSVLNYYVSGHPLNAYRDEVRGFASLKLDPDSLRTVGDGKTVTTGGTITSLRTHMQRDGRPMAFMEIEDFDGTIELIAFGDAYEQYRHLLAVDTMVLVKGTVMQEDERQAKIRVEKVMPLSDTREKLTAAVHIRMRTQGLEEELIREIVEQCRSASGSSKLIIHLVTREENEFRVRSKAVTVAPHKDMVERLREKLGRDNVWLSRGAA